MEDPIEEKRRARAEAAERRRALHRLNPGAPRQAAGHALSLIAPMHHVRMVAAYLPIRDEFDPTPAMRAMCGVQLDVCAPVIVGRGQPLRFRAWRADGPVARGPLGTVVPDEGEWVEPDLILAPLLAFDAAGWRLGYGGGYYDRTIAELRARRPVAVYGYAYAGQQVAATPHGPHDVRMDAVVTERGVVWPA